MTFDPKSYISRLTSQPGVYRMYGAGDEPLYIGKARNLKKRVASYFLRASGSKRIEAMVAQIRRIEVTVTHTEDEALVLEANLIKQHAPRYNVSLRDDKSFPYLQISGDHPYPRIAFYRGPKRTPHRYFGPYPSAAAVRETILSLQKLFRLRPCSDTFFMHRTRPCLQHQIKRCTAPCVRLISEEDYARDLAKGVQLLENRGAALAADLVADMERASKAQEYEWASRVRDQIAALRRLQADRTISPKAKNVDVIAIAPHAAHSGVSVVTVRDGINQGHRCFFPEHPPLIELPALLDDFLAQYYLERKPPPEILVPELPEERGWFERWAAGKAGRKVRLRRPGHGSRLRLMQMARSTADQALTSHLASKVSAEVRLHELQQALDLERLPQRLECFDISHTAGEGALASCVVFGAQGPLKSAYRKFNIAGITPGDDYAAIRQAVSRRFVRVKTGEVQAPDVLFIDGGQGQLGAALQALQEVGMESQRVVAVAKGEARKPGLEQLYMPERQEPLRLPADSPALHLIQSIRDEAHRFAITGHRGRRDKSRLRSELDSVEGLGPVRKRALLRELGGLGQVKRAGVEDLIKVPGISRALAERVYALFH